MELKLFQTKMKSRVIVILIHQHTFIMYAKFEQNQFVKICDFNQKHKEFHPVSGLYFLWGKTSKYWNIY